jgi:alanine dehydrogenase
LYHVLPGLRRVRVWSRSPDKVAQFCREVGAALPISVEPAADARSAVIGADVVVTCTNTSLPVLLGDWLEPGMHINAVGSNRLTAREVDDTVVLRADRIVADTREAAEAECGDLVPLVQAGRLRWADVAELGDVVAGAVPGRPSRAAITLFESHGIALWDLAAATLAHSLAVERGVGIDLPD